MRRKVYRLLDRVAGVLLPPRCLLCGGPGAGRARDLCTACEADLPWIDAACRRCGHPVEAPFVEACARCRDRPQPHRHCHAALHHEFPAAELVAALKYQGALAHARVLGTLLADSLARHGVRREVELLVPMPLHASRLIERGFNQSLEVARFTADGLDVEVDGRALRRLRATVPQVGLTRPQRADNVRGAFEADPARVAGRHVALIDDVVTTGATSAAAARALLAAGAATVDVWCVTRAASSDAQANR
ncbi:MAG TPA: double zinc ribbon domain-containing protein [Steroidobacteraceae bacterium]|nr:double zinc ribbon domain-containing protein [Steroidobacteraceae bacterium]